MDQQNNPIEDKNLKRFNEMKDKFVKSFELLDEEGFYISNINYGSGKVKYKISHPERLTKYKGLMFSEFINIFNVQQQRIKMLLDDSEEFREKFELSMEMPKWNLMKTSNIKSFHLGDEPEVIHTLRTHECIVVMRECGYDSGTGDVELLRDGEFQEKYGFDLRDYEKTQFRIQLGDKMTFFDGKKEHISEFQFNGFGDGIHPHFKKQMRWTDVMLRSVGVFLQTKEFKKVDDFCDGDGNCTYDFMKDLLKNSINPMGDSYVLLHDNEMGRGWAMLFKVDREGGTELLIAEHRDIVRDWMVEEFCHQVGVDVEITHY